MDELPGAPEDRSDLTLQSGLIIAPRARSGPCRQIADVRPLPVTGRPHEDESLFGFLLRMAAENELGGLHPILKLLGVQNCSELRATDIPLLARLFDCSPQELFRIAAIDYWVNGARVVRLRGHILQRPYLIRSRRPRVCGRCLRKGGYCRQVWDIAFFTWCPVHDVPLIDTCPACRRDLVWERRSVPLCRCGFDLSTAVALLPASPHAQLIGFHLWNACGGQPSAAKIRHEVLQAVSLEVHRVIRTLSLDGVLRLIWALGGDDRLAKKARRQPGVTEAAAWISAALSTLSHLLRNLDTTMTRLSRPAVTQISSLATDGLTQAERCFCGSLLERLLAEPSSTRRATLPFGQLTLNFIPRN